MRSSAEPYSLLERIFDSLSSIKCSVAVFIIDRSILLLPCNIPYDSLTINVK